MKANEFINEFERLNALIKAELISLINSYPFDFEQELSKHTDLKGQMFTCLSIMNPKGHTHFLNKDYKWVTCEIYLLDSQSVNIIAGQVNYLLHIVQKIQPSLVANVQTIKDHLLTTINDREMVNSSFGLMYGLSYSKVNKQVMNLYKFITS